MTVSAMTKEQREQIFQARKQLAELITNHPSHFYICEGCESILDFTPIPLNLCPRCGGYHFCYDRERLLEAAAILAAPPPEE